MKRSLSPSSIRRATARLKKASAGFAKRYRGESGRRQPVHTVYGGAHLFKADAASRLGRAAQQTLEEYAPDAKTFAAGIGLPARLAEAVYGRVLEKLGREPVEDFRIDFEDGYGNRPDEEEDRHAAQAALIGDILDDAATGQVLLNYFLRAMNCGATSENEALLRTGLSTAELRSGSFVKILKTRKATS